MSRAARSKTRRAPSSGRNAAGRGPGEQRERIRKRLRDESGTLFKEAPERVALVYPSPYRVGMSSLGFQTLYREINGRPGGAAERAFLPDNLPAVRAARTPLLCYESSRPVGDFPLVAFSVAYELELGGVVQALRLAGIPPLWERRGPKHPFVLCGGPLTFANALPLAPFADAILMGEADQTIHLALDIIAQSPDKRRARETLAREIDSCLVPAVDGERPVPMARCPVEGLPARSQIRTPHTELSDMFLVEAVRGCSRACAYCVMRAAPGRGMRVIDERAILGLLPEDARRVGLVGAGVSDHPRIAALVRQLAERGREVGLSSLRPDRLDDELAAALRQAGCRTLTTALDGASQRLRDGIGRRVRAEHLLSAIRLARAHGYQRLKLYAMVGLPGETDEDVNELIDLSRQLAALHPLCLSLAPFVPKLGTPLADAPFAGVRVLESRLRRLNRALDDRVQISATGARWARVEYLLAQGGARQGRQVLEAVERGGRLRDYLDALEVTAGT